MKVFRIEEMQALDIAGLRHELTKVRDEKKRLDAYESDLETQLGRAMRADPKPKADHTDTPDPGPRQAFIDSTKNMHLSEADKKLQTG